MKNQNSNDICRLLDIYKYRKDAKSLNEINEIKRILVNRIQSMYADSNESKRKEIELTSRKDFQLFKEGQEREVWKNLSKEDCPDFEGFEHYQISSFGRIKNKHGKLLKPWSNKKGMPYQKILLYSSGKHERFFIHRLVGFSFLNFEYRYLKKNGVTNIEINHRDKNPKNNHLSNLEWCSSIYNRKHELGKFDNAIKFYRYYNLQQYIICILFDCISGKLPIELIKDDMIEFPSYRSMSDLLNLDISTIVANKIPLELPLNTNLVI